MAVWAASGPAAVQLPARAEPPAIECAATVEGRPRVYRLAEEAAPKGPRWAIAMRPADRPGRWVPLTLPGARPVFGPGTAELTYRSGAGGIIVELRVSQSSSTLDVYVSYEVEVNVDAELSPAVDELNTHGVVEAACRVPAR